MKKRECASFLFLECFFFFTEFRYQRINCRSLNSLQNDNILGVTNIKAFVDDKINIAQVRISLFIG